MGTRSVFYLMGKIREHFRKVGSNPVLIGAQGSPNLLPVLIGICSKVSLCESFHCESSPQDTRNRGDSYHTPKYGPLG